MPDNNNAQRHIRLLLCATLTIALSACGAVGDTKSVKQASALAIDCETDDALAAVDRAAAGGGLGANLADLQRVVILRDAGRTAEANAAMAERNARVGANAKAAADAERAVSKSLADLQAERQKQTGRRSCP